MIIYILNTTTVIFIMLRTRYGNHVVINNQDFIVGNLVNANRMVSIAKYPLELNLGNISASRKQELNLGNILASGKPEYGSRIFIVQTKWVQ